MTEESQPDWKNYGADQVFVEQLARKAFSDKVVEDLFERALRIFEEAAELAQAEARDMGKAQTMLKATLERVLSRPKGKDRQEAGGVVVSTLIYFAVKGWRMDTVANEEIDRIRGLPPETFRQKQIEKSDAGTAKRPE